MFVCVFVVECFSTLWRSLLRPIRGDVFSYVCNVLFIFLQGLWEVCQGGDIYIFYVFAFVCVLGCVWKECACCCGLLVFSC